MREGKLEAFQKWFADFITDTVEPEEPRLLSFQAYVAPAANEVTIVQVHPDAESMMFHMSLIGEHVGAAYAEYLEHESSWQIYGIPRRASSRWSSSSRATRRSPSPSRSRSPGSPGCPTSERPTVAARRVRRWVRSGGDR